MSGIIATLQMRTPNAVLPEVAGGYVHLCEPRGIKTPECPADQSFDQWDIRIKWYACFEDYQTNPNANIVVDQMLLMDDLTPVMQSIQPNLPYVPHTDPMDAAKVVLQAWFPEGVIVP